VFVSRFVGGLDLTYRAWTVGKRWIARNLNNHLRPRGELVHDHTVVITDVVCATSPEGSNQGTNSVRAFSGVLRMIDPGSLKERRNGLAGDVRIPAGHAQGGRPCRK